MIPLPARRRRLLSRSAWPEGRLRRHRDAQPDRRGKDRRGAIRRGPWRHDGAIRNPCFRPTLVADQRSTFFIGGRPDYSVA